ncbi:hypothetical protein ACFXTH_035378 [Malus domestica]
MDVFSPNPKSEIRKPSNGCTQIHGMRSFIKSRNYGFLAEKHVICFSMAIARKHGAILPDWWCPMGP